MTRAREVSDQGWQEDVNKSGDTMTGTLNIDAATSLTTTGNVGIGTASPAAYASLDIVSSSSGVVQLRGGTGANQGGAYFVRDAANISALIAIGDDARINGGTPDLLATIQTSSVPIKFAPAGVEQARLTSTGDFQFNSGYGSVATAYGCRAWGSTNAAGGVLSGANISSITKGGTGNWGVNFTTPLVDGGYSVAATALPAGGGFQGVSPAVISPTTTGFSIACFDSTNYADSDRLLFSVFR